jgi:hypothetical protein
MTAFAAFYERTTAAIHSPANKLQSMAKFEACETSSYLLLLSAMWRASKLQNDQGYISRQA